MLIDSFTVLAQAVNFLILVYLLKRFLYQPIMRHMDEREERIRSRLQEASRKQEKAEHIIEQYRHKEQELQQKSAAKLEEAENEAQQHKKQLLEQAREEIQDKRRIWLEALGREQQTFARELEKHLAEEIFLIVQRAMQDLADMSLNNRMAQMMIDRIRNLDDDSRKKLRKIDSGYEIHICSTFELDFDQRDEIRAVLQEILEESPRITYRNDESYPLGIMVDAGGVKISWGIKSYLEELKEQVMNLIEEKAMVDKTPENMASQKTRSVNSSESGD